MVRSSGIPRRKLLSGIVNVTAARATSTVITRPSTSKGSLDETVETTTEHTEQLWVFDPNETSVGTLGGERQVGDLEALGVEPDTGSLNVQNGDRITHGGVEYEVETVVGAPDDENPELQRITLVRRQ